MRMKVMTVTPDMAREWLKKNKRNRNPVDASVGAMAREMSADRWMLTHQGIAFSTRGDLIDGQHRLMAIAESGTEVTTAVFFDVPHSVNKETGMTTMDAIDSGKARTVAHHLQISHGVQNAKRVASYMRAVASIFAPGYKNVSVGQALGLLKFFRESAIAIGSVESVAHLPATIGGVCVAVHEFAPTKAIEFATAYATEDGGKHHMATKLRKWMRDHPAQVGSGVGKYVAIAALYHFYNNASVQIIRANEEATEWLLSHHNDKREEIYRLLTGTDPADEGTAAKP